MNSAQVVATMNAYCSDYRQYYNYACQTIC